MGKIWAVLKREYLERVRFKGFLVATIFGPLLMAVLIILPAWLASRSKPSRDLTDIVILDASASGLGARVSSALSAVGPAPEVEMVAPARIADAESTATRRVVSKELQGYLIVDQVTVSGELARYAGRNATTMPDMQRLEAAIEQAIRGARFEAEGLDPQRMQALANVPLKLDAERLTERGRGGSGRGAVALAYTVAMLLYMSIVLYGQSIMMGVIEEKTQRVAEVVVSSVRPNQLLAGKVAGIGAVGLTQQLVWVLSGLLLLRFQVPIMRLIGVDAPPTQLPSVAFGTGLALLVYYILGYTLFSSLFAAAGSMVSSTQDAQQVATPLTMLIIPSLLLITPVLLEPNGALSTAVSLIPFTSPILMPVRMSLTNVPLWEVFLSMIMLAAMCFAAIWLAARIYRVGVLMYGKKPSLGELVRWIRYAH